MKKEAQEKSRELRKNGLSVKQIAEQLLVAQGSVSRWIVGMPLSEGQKNCVRSSAAKAFSGISDDILISAVNEGLNQKMIAERFGVSHNLVSRIFKRRGFTGKTKRGPIPNRKVLVCDVCGCTNNGKLWRGVMCDTCNSKIRRTAMKIMAVRKLGGTCKRCGWKPQDEEVVAMEFHHLGGEKKEFTIGRRLNYKWDSLAGEIAKCELLCSRCHRIEHSKRDCVMKYALARAATMTEG